MNKKCRMLSMFVLGVAITTGVSTITDATTTIAQELTNATILDMTTYVEGDKVTKNGDTITIDADGWVKFSSVDFGAEGLEHFVIDVSTETEVKPSSVRVYIDSMNNAETVAVQVEMLADQEVDFRALGADLSKSVTGVHDVYIKTDDKVNLSWARFTNIVEHKVNGLNGSSLAASLQKTIDSLNPYDVLQLEGTTYEMSRMGLIIKKPLIFRGKAPATNDYKTKVGASDLTTIFNNVGTITVQSNDVRMEHIDMINNTSKGVIVSVRVDGYPNTTNETMFNGFVTNNIRFFGGQYSIHTGNGAQVLNTHTSFENFNHHGLTLDRRIPVEINPQTYMDYCFFQPKILKKEDDSNANTVKYRTTDYYVPYNYTAVCYDAGNDEYLIWDISNSIFQNSVFIDTGLSYAKVANATIRNNTFIQNFGDVEMLHFEEFTNNILIENNLFESTTDGDRYTSRGIGIDREMQSTFDLIFRNNTITGGYTRFFNAYSPQGLIIENNDFTGAYSQSIQTPNGLVGDLFFYFTWNALGYHLDNLPAVGAKNIIIKDNKFNPETMERYKLSIEEYAGETTNYIQPELIVDKKVLDAEPAPLIEVNKEYRIRNKATGEYLYVKPDDEKIYYTEAPLEDGSDVWELGLERYIYYTLKNKKEGEYLEVKLPFTAAHMANNSKPAEVHAKILSDYKDNAFKPMWFFSKEIIQGIDYILMHPGYSECRSRLTREDGTDHAITEVARISSPASYKPFEDVDLWEFVPIDGQPTNPISYKKISFEAKDIVNYKVTGKNAGAALVKGAGVTDGTQAIRIDMKERQDDVEHAARLIVTPSLSEVWNLGKESTLHISLTNPNDYRAQIRVTLTDEHGNIRGLYYWLEAGETRNVEIGKDMLGEIGIDETKYAGTNGYFGNGVDPSCITELQIFFPENNASLLSNNSTGSFIVDNIYGFLNN